MSIQSEGRQLVIGILGRRRARCVSAEVHTAAHCKACGIHDNTTPQNTAPKGDPKP